MKGRSPGTVRRILVAVKELDAYALPAVLKAAQIARASGAEIELFHALIQPVYLDLSELNGWGVGALEEQLQLRALQKLERIAERLRLHSLPVSVSVAWDYPAHEAIIRRAVQTKAVLIVAQRYAGKHTAAGLLRLTDWELVKNSPVPLLLVKNPRPYRHPAVLAAVDPSHRHAKTSQLDQCILDTASTLSGQLRGTLQAVHAYDGFERAGLADAVSGSMLDGLDRQAREHAAGQLARALKSTKIARSRCYLVAAPPVTAIAEAARRSRAAIVVMGAVSRSGIKRLLIGNTAERILDALSCDIIIVRPQGFAKRISPAQRGARVFTSAFAHGLY